MTKALVVKKILIYEFVMYHFGILGLALIILLLRSQVEIVDTTCSEIISSN